MSHATIETKAEVGITVIVKDRYGKLLDTYEVEVVERKTHEIHVVVDTEE